MPWLSVKYKTRNVSAACTKRELVPFSLCHVRQTTFYLSFLANLSGRLSGCSLKKSDRCLWTCLVGCTSSSWRSFGSLAATTIMFSVKSGVFGFAILLNASVCRLIYRHKAPTMQSYARLLLISSTVDLCQSVLIFVVQPV